VEDAAVVGVLEGVGEGAPDRDDLLDRQRAVPVEAPGEVRALREVHDQVGAALVLAGGLDGDDVRVVEPGQGPGLAEEALALAGRRPPPGREELERDAALEDRVVGPVDGAGPAAADRLDELVGADAPRSVRPPHYGRPGASGATRTGTSTRDGRTRTGPRRRRSRSPTTSEEATPLGPYLSPASRSRASARADVSASSGGAGSSA